MPTLTVMKKFSNKWSIHMRIVGALFKIIETAWSANSAIHMKNKNVAKIWSSCEKTTETSHQDAYVNRNGKPHNTGWEVHGDGVDQSPANSNPLFPLFLISPSSSYMSISLGFHFHIPHISLRLLVSRNFVDITGCKQCSKNIMQVKPFGFTSSASA